METDSFLCRLCALDRGLIDHIEAHQKKLPINTRRWGRMVFGWCSDCGRGDIGPVIPLVQMVKSA